MKVYFINTSEDLSNATAKIMLSIASAVKSKGGLYKIYSSKGRSRVGHAFLSRLTDREGTFSSRSTRALLRDIAKFSPDIVHLSNLHGHYLNYKLLFEGLRSIGVPVVWSVHDLWPVTGHCAVPFDCDLWKNGCQKCHHIDYYPRSWWANKSAQNFADKSMAFGLIRPTIVVASEYMKSSLASSFLSSCNCQVIPNGVDTETFHPVGKPKNDGKVKILGVARNWESGKNQKFFDSLAYARPDWEITLVGRVNHNKYRSIKALNYVYDSSELTRIYSSADVFVNPSEFESFGMVVFEAMACGVPVVVNDKTATKEFINDRVGRIVDFGNLEEAILAIKEAVKLNRKECAGYVSNHFSSADVAMRYFDLFCSVIEK